MENLEGNEEIKCDNSSCTACEELKIVNQRLFNQLEEEKRRYSNWILDYMKNDPSSNVATQLEENKLLKEKFSELQLELEQKTDLIKKLEDKVFSLQKEEENWNREKVKGEYEVVSLKEMLDLSETSQEELQLQNQELQKTIQTLEEKNVNLIETLEQMKQQTSSLNLQFNQVQKERDQFKAEKTSSENSMHDVTMQLHQTLETQQNAYTQEIEKLENKLNFFEVEKQKLVEDFNRVLKEKEILDRKYNDSVQKLNEMSLNFEVQTKKLKEENEILNEKLENLQKDLQEILKEKIIQEKEFSYQGKKDNGKRKFSTISKKSNSSQKVIIFSGFKELEDNVKDDLMKKVQHLGGTIISSSEFTKDLTHVVAPPGSRTMKTLAAALTHRWLVSPDWILESFERGEWLPEQDFGQKYTQCVFESIKFYLDPSFLKENEGKQKISNCRTLIEQLGRGFIVDDPQQANYILIATNDKDNYPGRTLTWNAFLDLIPGSNVCNVQKKRDPLLTEKNQSDGHATNPHKKIKTNP